MRGLKVVMGFAALASFSILISVFSPQDAANRPLPAIGPTLQSVLLAPAVSNASSDTETMLFENRILCRDNQCQPVIYAHGAIGKGAYKAFSDHLAELEAQHDYRDRVCLNSDGGMLNEGMAIALEIRMRGMDTCAWHSYSFQQEQVDNAHCASACSTIFFGGNRRHALANNEQLTSIGVHQFSFPYEGGNETAADFQAIMSTEAKLLSYFGIEREIQTLAGATPAQEIYYLSVREARRLGVLQSGNESQSGWVYIPDYGESSTFADNGLALTKIRSRDNPKIDVEVFIGRVSSVPSLLLVISPQRRGGLSNEAIFSDSNTLAVAYQLDNLPIAEIIPNWMLSERGTTSVIPLDDLSSEAIVSGAFELRVWTEHMNPDLQIDRLSIDLESGRREIEAALTP